MSAIKTYADTTGSKLIFNSLILPVEVEFYAFVTSFGQSFASTWNSEQVYGRNDPIGNFQGTARTLNLSWDVPSANLGEAQTNLEKMDTLAKMLYPAYSKANFTADDGTTVGSNALSLSKAPLIRLKYANLIKDQGSTVASTGLLGWIGNLSWTPVIEMGMFTANEELFPKVISLAIDFTVQHEHVLGHTPGSDLPAKFPFGG
mgnify:FL=1|tara:strand:- start:340 stop:948 length:609 start_codon:yes stop_codon:yes gene_type:complete